MRTTFDEAIAPGEKDYDFNIQQYSITAERDEFVDFSLPYYNDQKALLVPGDSPAATATTFADIQDLKYGATIGTTDADYITETIGIPEADVAIYDDQAATFAALDAGQIDATVIGLPDRALHHRRRDAADHASPACCRGPARARGRHGHAVRRGQPGSRLREHGARVADRGRHAGRPRRGVDAGRRRHPEITE